MPSVPTLGRPRPRLILLGEMVSTEFDEIDERLNRLHATHDMLAGQARGTAFELQREILAADLHGHSLQAALSALSTHAMRAAANTQAALVYTGLLDMAADSTGQPAACHKTIARLVAILEQDLCDETSER